MQDLGGRKLGQYELRERLGRGGMAEVYKAYQASMDRFIAVKVMLGHLVEDDDFVERFRREAQAVGRLRHPNIVNIFDFGIQDAVYYMAMEYIDGGTLKDRSKDIGRFNTNDALRITSQLASALDYAHNAGMIHRDVKPANIMFTNKTYQDVVLTDFGIARILNQTGLTATGAYVGTPDYMSPEAGHGDPTDERADLYALGIILYEMLTGTAPYSADTPLAVMLKHMNAPLPTISEYGDEIPEVVEKIILRSMAKDPNDRYQTAAAMKTDVDRAQAILQETAATVVVPDAKSRKVVGETTIGTTQGLLPDERVVDDSPSSTVLPTQSKENTSTSAGLLTLRNIVIVAVLVGIIAVAAFFTNRDNNTAGETDITQIALAAETEEATDEPVIETEVVVDTETEEPLIESEAVTEEVATNTATPTEEPNPEPSPTMSASRLLDQGYAAGADGDLEAALALFEQATDLEPDNYEALTALADTHAQLGNIDEALEAWNTVIELNPDDRLAHLRRGQILVEQDDLETALVDFDFVIDNAPEGGDDLMMDARLARGYQFITLNRIEKARDDFQQVVDYDPTQINALMEVGYNEVRLGNTDAALEAFNQVLEQESAFYDAVNMIAQIYRGNEQHEEAIDHLTIYLEGDFGYNNSELANLYWLRAENYLFLNDLESAVSDLEQSVDLDETVNNAAALANLGWTLADLGNTENGIIYLRRYVQIAEENNMQLDTGAVNKLSELEQDNPSIVDDLASAQADNAETVTEDIVMDIPPHPNNLMLLRGESALMDEIDNLILDEEQDVALGILEIELDDNPDDINLLYLQSQVYASHYDEGLTSRQIAERMIELDPDNVLGQIALADSYLTYPDYSPEQAREILVALLPDHDDNPDVLFRFARLANWEEEPDLAYTAESLGASGWRFVDYMGNFLYDSKQYDRALPYLYTIYEAQRPYITSYEAAANLMGALVQTGQADTALAIAYDIEGDMDSFGFADIGFVAYEAGDYEQARDWAETAKALDDTAIHADWLLALIAWWADNDLQTASALFQPMLEEPYNYYSRYLNDTFKHTVALDYARILQDAGDLDGALEYYNIAVENFSYQAWIYEERADLFIDRDELESAQDDLRTAFEIADDSDYRRDLRERLRELEAQINGTDG